MEALVPAFVAAVFAQLGERSPWLTAILADRYGRPMVVLIAAAIAHAAGNAVAAAGAMLIAPLLVPEAKLLLLALALGFAGLGSLWPLHAPDRLEGWRLGSFLTALLGSLILAAGDATQFLTFAIGTRSSMPWLAGVGAAAGALLVNGAAALMGELEWRALPLKWVRIATGLIFLGLAGASAASALGLI